MSTIACISSPISLTETTWYIYIQLFSFSSWDFESCTGSYTFTRELTSLSNARSFGQRIHRCKLAWPASAIWLCNQLLAALFAGCKLARYIHPGLKAGIVTKAIKNHSLIHTFLIYMLTIEMMIKAVFNTECTSAGESLNLTDNVMMKNRQEHE